jgi:hypothetical protein
MATSAFFRTKMLIPQPQTVPSLSLYPELKGISPAQTVELSADNRVVPGSNPGTVWAHSTPLKLRFSVGTKSGTLPGNQAT